MKKLLSFLVCLTLCVGSATAQSSMTDNQIMQFVAKQHEAGKTNEDIAKELVMRGVSVDRLKKLKEQYEKKQASGEGSKLTGVSQTQSRMRGKQNIANYSKNAEKLDDNGMMGTTVRGKKTTANGRTTTANGRTTTGKRTGMRNGKGGAYRYDDMEPMTLSDSLYMELEEIDPDEVVEVEEKRIFGHDIFNNEYLSFEPNENAPTPANYTLGPGDEVYIDIYGGSQKSIEATISPDGTVTIDGVGPVRIGGMTVTQATSRLRSATAERYASSNVQLTVGNTRAINVNVMGEVVAPGTYTMSAFATVFHALYAAGGVNDIGTMRSIMVYRSGKKVADVDVYDYILHGNTRSDVRLNTGDVVYVGPYASLVNMDGKVKRPMYYEMRQNETLATALGFTGGFAGDAYKQTVRVVRKNGNDYTVHTVEEFDFGSFRMMDGDEVTVDSIAARFSNMVEVKGAVHHPGKYQMDGKTKTVRELLTLIGGAKEEALMERAVIYRLKEDRSKEVKSFNLGAMMRGEVADIPLRNEDIIEIYDTEETRSGRTLTIYGEVNFPGIYDFAEGSSVEDLILLAGGLTDYASLQNVEVSRRINNPNSTRQDVSLSQNFTFNITRDLAHNETNTFTLEPFDEVYVRRSPTWSENRNVTVAGEVNFAGTYPLKRKDDRLSDIIKRAGGLSDFAYAEGAHLERMMSDEDMDRKKAIERLTKAAADSIDVSTLDMAKVYTVGINLKAALENPGGVDDIVLMDGDRLVIPEVNNVVKVNGAVMYPNAITWQKGKPVSYYVELAGGYNQNAKKSKTYIVNINGTTQKASKVKELLPGSEIVVPVKPERKKMSPAEIAAIGTAASALATMVATVTTLIIRK